MSSTEEGRLSPPPASPETTGDGSREGLRRDAALAVATGFAIQAALVVTGPLLARMLGPDGRGYLAALILWPLVITQLGNLGIPSALTYSIARDPSTSRGVARLGLSFALPQAILLIGFQALWLALILHGDPHQVRIAGWLTLALVPAMLAQQYGLGLLQGHMKLVLFNALRFLPWFLYAVGVATLFVVGEHAIIAVVGVLLAGYVISGSACLLSGLRASRGEAPPSVDRRFMASFGLRGLLASFSAVDVLRPDQVVLALFLSPAALGLYVVGLAFTNLPYFIAKSLGLVTFPWVASREETGHARRTMWSLLWLTTGIAVAIVAVLCASAHWLVPFFFGDAFDDAVAVTYIVLPGTVFLCARRVLSEGLKGRGYPLAGTLGELLALAWVAIALAISVPLWGIYGAAISLASSYAVSLALLVVVAARHGELESARRSLLSLPRDVISAVRRSRRPEVAFQESDRPARAS